MKVKTSLLRQIVLEELAFAAHRMLKEASKDEDAPKTSDADEDKEKKSKKGGKGEASPVSPESGPEAAGTAKKPVDIVDISKQEPSGKKPAKGSTPPDEEQKLDTPTGPEGGDELADDDPSDAEGGEGKEKKVSEEIVGKTVQSISMEPKSKILPGAIEISVSFNEVTDALKILIPKSGAPKFFWRGSLHNEI